MDEDLKRKRILRDTLTRAQLVIVAGALLLSTSAGFVGGWLGASSRQKQLDDSGQSQATQISLNASQVTRDIAKRVGEGVVSINVTSQATANDFFGFGLPVTQRSAGTGFILNEEGIVLTNRHVLPAGAGQVSITLSDGTRLDDVEILGRTGASDPLDVAFLKIRDTKGKELKPVQLGDSAATQVGDKVIAIGNALGQFQNTVTEGIISGFGRTIEAQDEAGSDSLQNLFQTDAAINQGNSGGPLVDINGKVIGVNTAVAGGQAQNIGFAIPIDDIKGLIASVLETGKVQRPYLGVRYVQLTDDIAYQLNLDIRRGAYIVPGRAASASILPNSPAAKAGLQEKDIITKVNGENIDENRSLVSLLGRHKVGDTVTLTVSRDRQEREVKVTLEAAPES